mmetsp:Transcript_76340/g.158994  ORF Transcript_76340/g.158994 Transcript_76340/m.158994 type:complete len:270 (-) Transcript_76340:133-942(-)|eukprot:CAMPEP_0206439792 /NCGR_PEP_ID=MMETSP0324_2-20121206/12409_1 /ASSEMBLY_ACC=CAM_ASM_000836 /TAXON_ID=2866 /ORGANISM="Crypthecodinium cohnii, Strain Seligo" /LENGTH=269 /DNA_ID=CAMNT_0053907455 /DNA_START=70 /DNA_END=879 /DNA_ORIENTATION=-
MTDRSAEIEHIRSETVLFQKRMLEAGALEPRPVRISMVASPTGTKADLKPGEKLLHLVRHGQGFHNLLADLYREAGRTFDSQSGAGGDDNPYKRVEVLDSPLTELGRRQAKALQEVTPKLDVDLVVVSPHTRATQTALLAFASLVESKKVPFVAHEGCREIHGVHTCDQRRPISELRVDFPQIDYDQTNLSETDPLFSPEVREPMKDLADRGYNFLLWVRERPESCIAVASHFAFLITLVNAAVLTDDDKLKGGFLTGELRSVILCYED